MIYVAIRHNEPRTFAAVIRRARGGDQSHTEVAVPAEGRKEHWCVSASYLDGGVRDRWIDITDPAKWRVYRWDKDHLPIGQWIEDNRGKGYDFIGLFGLIWRPFGHRPNRMFCSEVTASILGLPEPELYDPRTTESVVAKFGTRVFWINGEWVA